MTISERLASHGSTAMARMRDVLWADNRPIRHVVAGAGARQGTTTVALAMAALSARKRPTTLVAADWAEAGRIAGFTCSIEGPVQVAPGLTFTRTVPEVAKEITVVDAGRIPVLHPRDATVPERRWMVVRGTCQESVRTAVANRWAADGAVILLEPSHLPAAASLIRSLDVGIVAVVRPDPQVARAVETGSLPRTAVNHRALDQLSMLLCAASDPSLGGPGDAGIAHGPTSAFRLATRISHRLQRLQHPSNGIDRSLQR